MAAGASTRRRWRASPSCATSTRRSHQPRSVRRNWCTCSAVRCELATCCCATENAAGQHTSAAAPHRQRVQKLVRDVEGGAVGGDLIQRAVPADLHRQPRRRDKHTPIEPGAWVRTQSGSAACRTLQPDSALTAVAGPATGGGAPSQRSTRHWRSRSKPLTCAGSTLLGLERLACSGPGRASPLLT